MRIRHRLGSLTAVVLLGAALVVAAGQRQPPTFTPEQEARLQIREVKDGLYVIPGFDGNMSGGNVAVRVTDEGVIIVDDKYLHSYDFIAAQVRSVTDQPIRYDLNTHHHFDHAGSNADFMQNAVVIAHKNARANIVRNDQTGAPRLVFGDETAVFLGGVEVQARRVGRGHTSGDAVIYFPDLGTVHTFPDLGTVHTGDLFVWGQLLTIGPRPLCRDPRGLARGSPLPEHGLLEGAEERPRAGRRLSTTSTSAMTVDLHNLTYTTLPFLQVNGSRSKYPKNPGRVSEVTAQNSEVTAQNNGYWNGHSLA